MKRIKTPLNRGRDELDREAQSLLARLERGSTILRDGQGCLHLADEHSVGTAPARELPKKLVAHCLAEDWLERRGDSLVLSEVGRARLRRSGDTGDAFREQHQLRTIGDRDVNGVRRPVLVNDAESPLGWLKSRKDRNGRPLITSHQYDAGERLRADYWFAHLTSRVTSSWSALASSAHSRRAAPSNAAAFRDEVIAAKERVMRALMAVGPEVSGVLVDVCCELKGLEDAEKENGWPQRAGKVVLQIALTRLARHYGLISDDQPRLTRRDLRHWGSEDYRPTLDAWRSGRGAQRKP